MKGDDAVFIFSMTTKPAGVVAGWGRMGDLVNLKRFKKRGERHQLEQQAQANRVRFGRSKSERILDQERAQRSNDMLDQHRIDGEDAS